MNGVGASASAFQLKRIYEPSDPSDGKRVLIDRLWPRGISKEQAELTSWMKDIAPSAELRAWFQHVPERFAEFKFQYERELTSDTAQAHLSKLRSWAQESRVTLLYAAKDPKHNHAVVLLGVLNRSAHS